MESKALRDIVIVGGGTSGWMTATALATVLKGQYNIRLVESDDIGIIGVGEATIPMIQRYNQTVGIDESEFLKATHGTFKLGIEFVNWGRLGDRYMHGFGVIGQDLWTVRFDQYWQKMRKLGQCGPLEDYSITRSMAKANKFMPAQLDMPNSPLRDINYAYHFDASLYAKFLRGIAEGRGVKRVEGKIVRVTQREGDGFVTGVELENGSRVEGELFIDCTGFRGLLIGETLQTPFEDWAEWLFCDRAVALPCESAPDLTPYTRSTAHKAGWQWRIPLQHRIGNGHVYSSRHMSEDEAVNTLLANLDGKPLAEPRSFKFLPGQRSQCWNRNVVAIGLASGFVEPLESTAIHLVQSQVQRLIEHFPDRDFCAIDRDEYNRKSRFEYERIRDFIILHYKLNQRQDSAFWQHCAQMAVPDTLQHKIDIYRSRGRLLRVGDELFAEVAWLQVMEGQNAEIQGYNPLADLQSDADTAEYLASVREVIAKCVDIMPDHSVYIAEHCKA